MKKIDLINGNIPKSLLLFALPNILTYFATYLYYAVDIFVLSLSGAEEEISAVMSGLTPVTLATSLIIGVSVGGTFLVGQYHGAKDIEGRRKAIMSFGIFLLTFSIVLAILIASFSPLIISWLNVEESLKDQAIRYLALATISIPFTGLTYFINAVYKGCGKSIFPFVYTGGGIALNLIFDFIFVYALGLKSDGAPISLILSFFVSSALAVTWVIVKEKGLKRIGRPTLDIQNIKRIIKFG